MPGSGTVDAATVSSLAGQPVPSFGQKAQTGGKAVQDADKAAQHGAGAVQKGCPVCCQPDYGFMLACTACQARYHAGCLDPSRTGELYVIAIITMYVQDDVRQKVCIVIKPLLLLSQPVQVMYKVDM